MNWRPFPPPPPLMPPTAAELAAAEQERWQYWTEQLPALISQARLQFRRENFLSYLVNSMLHLLPAHTKAVGRFYQRTDPQEICTIMAGKVKLPNFETDYVAFHRARKVLDGKTSQARAREIFGPASGITNINFVSPLCGYTLLHHAAGCNNLAAFKVLIELGALVHHTNGALSSEQLREYQDARKAVTDFTERDLDWRQKFISPFWLAAGLFHTQIVEYIIEITMKKNEPEGMRALHWCAELPTHLYCPFPDQPGIPGFKDSVGNVIQPRDIKFISVWHFALFRKKGLGLLRELLRHLTIPIHYAMDLFCYGEEETYHLILETITEQQRAVRNADFAQKPGHVIWSFSVAHHEYMGLMSMHHPFSGMQWNYRHKRFSIENLMKFFALPAYNRLQRQAQLLYLQLCLMALATAEKGHLQFNQREQLFLIWALWEQGVRMGGLRFVTQCSMLAFRKMEMKWEDPHRFAFVSAMTLYDTNPQKLALCYLCEVAREAVHGTSVHIASFMPLALRLASHPLPADGKTFVALNAEDADVENCILHVLNLCRFPMRTQDLREVVVDDLHKIAVNPQAHHLHAGASCVTYNETQHNRGIHTDHQALAQGASYLPLNRVITPWEYVYPDLQHNDYKKASAWLDEHLPKSSTLDQILDQIGDSGMTDEIMEWVWPESTFNPTGKTSVLRAEYLQRTIDDFNEGLPVPQDLQVFRHRVKTYHTPSPEN